MISPDDMHIRRIQIKSTAYLHTKIRKVEQNDPENALIYGIWLRVYLIHCKKIADFTGVKRLLSNLSSAEYDNFATARFYGYSSAVESEKEESKYRIGSASLFVWVVCYRQ